MIDRGTGRRINAMLGTMIWRARNGQPGTYDRVGRLIELGRCGDSEATSVVGMDNVYECTLPDNLMMSVHPGDIIGIEIARQRDYRFGLYFDTNRGPINYEFDGNVSTVTLNQPGPMDQP